MWLFDWWQKRKLERKFRTVAYRPWSIEWLDEYGMKIPGDADVGFWILQENGRGERRFFTTTKPCKTSLLPGYAQCVLWVETGVYPVNAQLVEDD
nr:MAG TPA: hypothetical protein [Caudoviricetes sp.]